MAGFSIETRGPLAVLRLNGGIRSDENAAFADALRSLLAAGRPLAIVDASGADYLNSRALGDLVVFCQEVRNRGGEAALAGLCPLVLRTVRCAGLEVLVDIHADVAGAERALLERGGRKESSQ